MMEEAARRLQRPAVVFVIMAGGKGERLWPLVSAQSPKVCLSPQGGASLLRSTIARLRSAWPGAEWLIVTTREQAAAVRRELPPGLRQRLLVEPMLRNTAACITLAAVAVAARTPHAILVAVPADHWIRPVRAFRRAVVQAIHAAARYQTVAMIGVRPRHGHAGLGYLRVGTRISSLGHPRTWRLAEFIEKPAVPHAKRLARRPGVYWNSGVFVGPAQTVLDWVARWLPSHAKRLASLQSVLRRPEAWSTPSCARRLIRAYRGLAPVSFDNGAMMKAQRGIIVEGVFQWEDLGSWEAWARVSNGRMPMVAVDSHRIAAVGPEHHLIAAVGVDNLVVVHTPSVTLICRRDRTQAVRQAARGASRVLALRATSRPPPRPAGCDCRGGRHGSGRGASHASRRGESRDRLERV
jgi:mannose-1-phosphate guanylyltransferase